MKIRIQSKTGHKIIDINRRRSIREKCLNCSSWIPKGVSNCEFFDCHLWEFRSGKGNQYAAYRKKAIQSYCLSCMNGRRHEVVHCTSIDCSLFPYRRSRVDNSVNIDSSSKSDRIEAVSEDKIESIYQS